MHIPKFIRQLGWLGLLGARFAGGSILVCRHIRVKLTEPLTGNLSSLH